MRNSLILLTALSLMSIWNCKQNTDSLNDQESQDFEAIHSTSEDSLDLYFDILDNASEENIMNEDPNWLAGCGSIGKVTYDGIRFGRIRTRASERKIIMIIMKLKQLWN